MGMGRAEYVRQALLRMKVETEASRRKKRLQEASLKVRGEIWLVDLNPRQGTVSMLASVLHGTRTRCIQNQLGIKKL